VVHYPFLINIQNIIYRGPSDPDAPAPITKAAKAAKGSDGISLLQSLISSVNSKAAPCRALFSIPMDIGPGLRIGVKGFITIKRQEVVKSCYIWVGGEKAQIATGVGGLLNEDTSRPVGASEIRKAYVFGGEQITFTEDERKSFRDFGENCIRIIGFKPMSMLPEWANTRTSVFVYPDEEDYIGSTRTFSALHQTLLKQQKFAFAWVKPRVNAHPMLGAVIAGEEKVNEDEEQIRPPGLWIIPLPFADDIRKRPDVPQVRAPDVLVDRMKAIMDQLRLPKSEYDPSRYPNPCKF
jgi:ATP-dependent DNA helicase 2 subunit 1